MEDTNVRGTWNHSHMTLNGIRWSSNRSHNSHLRHRLTDTCWQDRSPSVIQYVQTLFNIDFASRQPRQWHPHPLLASHQPLTHQSHRQPPLVWSRPLHHHPFLHPSPLCHHLLYRPLLDQCRTNCYVNGPVGSLLLHCNSIVWGTALFMYKL